MEAGCVNSLFKLHSSFRKKKGKRSDDKKCQTLTLCPKRGIQQCELEVQGKGTKVRLTGRMCVRDPRYLGGGGEPCTDLSTQRCGASEARDQKPSRWGSGRRKGCGKLWGKGSRMEAKRGSPVQQ